MSLPFPQYPTKLHVHCMYSHEHTQTHTHTHKILIMYKSLTSNTLHNFNITTRMEWDTFTVPAIHRRYKSSHEVNTGYHGNSEYTQTTHSYQHHGNLQKPPTMDIYDHYNTFTHTGQRRLPPFILSFIAPLPSPPSLIARLLSGPFLPSYTPRTFLTATRLLSGLPSYSHKLLSSSHIQSANTPPHTHSCCTTIIICSWHF